MSEDRRQFSEQMIGIWKWAASVYLVLVFALAGLVEADKLTPYARDLLVMPLTASAGIWAAGAMGLALLFTFPALVIRVYGERRESKLAQQVSEIEGQLRRTQRDLAQTELQLVTDPITGIPNFRSWQKHAANWPRTDGAEKLSCLVIIDLDNFGALNDTSHECANSVLELFARQTYRAMRRNEYAFKIPDKKGPPQISNQVAMFRHYAGGDEFCFHMIGDPLAAAGFIERLRKSCEGFEEEIKNSILPKYMGPDDAMRYRLSFCAAIVPIEAKFPPEDVVSSALQLLTNAKKSSETRVLVQFEPQGTSKTLSQVKLQVDAEVEAVEHLLSVLNGGSGASQEDRKVDLSKQLAELRQHSSMLSRIIPNFTKSPE